MKSTLRADEKAYKNMEAVAKMLEATSKNGTRYEVRDVYRDYGQNWMWTTICSRGEWECQVLNPREWTEIVIADTIDELVACVNSIQNDKYFMG